MSDRASSRPLALIGALLGAALATLPAGQAVAFGGQLVRLPGETTAALPYSPRTGLRVEVDARWFDRGGYRPVQVRFTTAAPATSAKHIRFTLHAMEARARGVGGPGSMSVQRELTLEAGSDTAEALLLLPAMREWRFAWWEAEVDGRIDDAVSVSRGKAVSLAGAGLETDLRLLLPTITGSPAQDASRAGRAKRYVPLARLTVDEVRCEPLDDWLAYSAADIVVLELRELRLLPTIRPAAVEALRRWVLAGGTLWVERTDAPTEGLTEIDRLLGAEGWRWRTTEEERPEETETPAEGVETPETTAAADSDPVDQESAGEGVALKSVLEGPAPADPDDESKSKARAKRYNPVEGVAAWGYVRFDADNDAKKAAERLLRRGNAVAAARQFFATFGDTKGWYAERDLAFGQVVAFEGSALDVPPAFRVGGALIASRAWQRRKWSNRHGLEPGGASGEFGNLLIPGVGVAPVLEFQVLITLFVLVIGPLNYWLLWRREQLQMLVVTTPLCAALFTLGLFAYASLGDGFGVKARVRSMTLLNQQRGEAVSWSRVSQYAATAPAEPPTLPADAAVYPIDPAWESAIADSSGARRVEWTDTSQTLASGWLPTRTAVQNLIVRSQKTSARLVFATSEPTDTSEEAGPPPAPSQVSNQLGADLELLLVRDGAGDWLRATRLADGAIAELEPVTDLEALQGFRGLALEAEPEFPIGAGKAIEQTLERFASSSELRQRQSAIAAVRLDANLGSQRIDALTGLDGGRALDVPPRSYVAVAAEAVVTPLGVEDATEVGSFHVVAGRW